MNISRTTIMWSAILVIVFVQAPHLAAVFAEVSKFTEPWMRIGHGLLFAIAVDFPVLLFAIKGRGFITALFMLASYVITLQFYRDWIDFTSDPLMSSTILMISAIGVLAVYFLSHEITKTDDSVASKLKPDQRQQFLDKIQEQSSEIIKLKDERQSLKSMYEEYVRDSELKIQDLELKDSYGVDSGFNEREIAVIRAMAKEKDVEKVSKELDVAPDFVNDTVRKFKNLYNPEEK